MAQFGTLNPPPNVFGGIGAAYLGSSEAIDYVGFDNHIYRIYRLSNNWYHDDLTVNASAGSFAQGYPSFQGSLSLYSSSSINIVAYLDWNLNISELYTGSGQWHWQNLNTLSGAPSADGRPSLAYTSQYHEVAYRGTDNNVYLIYNAGSGWHYVNLTSLTGAPLAAGDPSLAIIGSNSAIVYVDVNGHVQEIYN